MCFVDAEPHKEFAVVEQEGLKSSASRADTSCADAGIIAESDQSCSRHDIMSSFWSFATLHHAALLMKPLQTISVFRETRDEYDEVGVQGDGENVQLHVGNEANHITQGESDMVMESSQTSPIDMERGQAKDVVSDAHGQ